MKQYLDLLRAIRERGYQTSDRTGTGTIAIPGYSYQISLRADEQGNIHDFPLLTTKFVSLKAVFIELMWKLRGETNIKPLIEQGVHIWTEWPFKKWLQETNQTKILNHMWKDEQKSDYSDLWKSKKAEFESLILADKVRRIGTAAEIGRDVWRSISFAEEWGSLGRTYGHHFRNFGEVTFNDFDEETREDLFHACDDISGSWINGKDQLLTAIDQIKNDPDSRRIIISLWNAQDTENTLLPPCPCFYQFFANQEGYLHMNLYQRSADSFLGVPYNTAQDALFLCMMAQVTGRKPGTFTHFFGDAHIYQNHLPQVDEQLQREPLPLPTIRLNPEIKNILDFTWEDIKLLNYEHYTPIRAAVSI